MRALLVLALFALAACAPALAYRVGERSGQLGEQIARDSAAEKAREEEARRQRIAAAKRPLAFDQEAGRLYTVRGVTTLDKLQVGIVVDGMARLIDVSFSKPVDSDEVTIAIVARGARAQYEGCRAAHLQHGAIRVEASEAEYTASSDTVSSANRRRSMVESFRLTTTLDAIRPLGDNGTANVVRVCDDEFTLDASRVRRLAEFIAEVDREARTEP